MTDFRALCAELAVALDHNRQCLLNDRRLTHPLADKARAALAKPDPEVVEPTDEEVEAWAGDQGFIRGHGDHPCGFWIDDGDAGAFARAVLARYGHHPAPPAEREVPDGPAVSEGREPASVKAEPSDKELLELMPQQLREDLATVSRMAVYGAGTGVTPGLFRVSLNTGALDFARAVLARYGNHFPDATKMVNQPAPPPAGEVQP